MSLLGQIYFKLTLKYEDFKRGLDSSEKKMRDFSDILKKTKTLAKGLFAGYVITQLIKLGNASLKAAGQFEQFETSLSVMLGSLDKAKILLKDLEKFSANTPLEMTQLVGGAKKLLAFGIEADKVVDRLGRLGDVSQGQADTMERVILAYGKAATKGKASNEELNAIAEAGVPIFSKLASQMGVTKSQIIKMAEQGKIKFRDLDKAMVSMTSKGGQFHDMLKKTSKDFNGRVSTMKDNFGLFAKDVGMIFLPAAKWVVEGLTWIAKGGQWAAQQMRASFIMMHTGILEVRKSLATATGDMNEVAKINETIIAKQKELHEVLNGVNGKLGGNFKITVAGEVDEKSLKTQTKALDLEFRKRRALADWSRKQEIKEEIKHLQKKLKLYKEGTNEYKELLIQKYEAEKAYNEEKNRLDKEANEKIRERNEDTADFIIDSLDGVLKRTETFGDAMKRVAMEIALDYAKIGIVKLLTRNNSSDASGIIPGLTASGDPTKLSGGGAGLSGLLDGISGSSSGAAAITAAGLTEHLKNSLAPKGQTNALGMKTKGGKVFSTLFGPMQLSENKTLLQKAMQGVHYFDDVLSGFRANGGPVQKGRSYVVGEDGKEVFTPDSNGRIVSNDELGGVTQNVHNNFVYSPTIQSNEGDLEELLAKDKAKFKEFAVGAVQEAIHTNKHGLRSQIKGVQ